MGVTLTFYLLSLLFMLKAKALKLDDLLMLIAFV